MNHLVSGQFEDAMISLLGSSFEDKKRIESIHKAAARKWDRKARDPSERIRVWQQCPTIVRHLNQKICGEPIEEMNAGLNVALGALLAGRRLARGISVGCGLAIKELRLLTTGHVDHLECFDISREMIRGAVEQAATEGMSDRVTLRNENAFEVAEGPYDIVHWNSSLHHMLDVEAAVGWSYRVLKPGGILYVREYVGPNRFQFSDRQIRLATRFRSALPPRLLRKPNGKRGPVEPCLVSEETVIASDPTEAVDSARILPSIRKYFPDAEIWELGGVIFRIALTRIIGNFDEKKDEYWLKAALAMDDTCVEFGESLIAAALAVKPGP